MQLKLAAYMFLDCERKTIVLAARKGARSQIEVAVRLRKHNRWNQHCLRAPGLNNSTHCKSRLVERAT